jgi:hypothetical protein
LQQRDWARLVLLLRTHCYLMLLLLLLLNKEAEGLSNFLILLW